MDRLWTPWRFSYLAASEARQTECVFCRLVSESADRENLILIRREHAFLVLNRFPYTSGHLMVVSRRHLATLNQATPEELEQIMGLARQSERALQEVYDPHGFNVGFNIGKSAGAGIAGHLHLHVVPRWEGDANFISVIGETRIIPEELETTYQKLSSWFRA